MDRLILRAIDEGNENYASLERSTLDYLIKLNEHLDIKSYVDKKFREIEESRLRQSMR